MSSRRTIRTPSRVAAAGAAAGWKPGQKSAVGWKPGQASTAALAGAAMSAAAARAAYAAFNRWPPGGRATWMRTNHRGDELTLAEGPAAALSAAAAAALTPGLPGRIRAALSAAGLGAAAFGCYDDLAGSGGRRGFRGHLGALAHGEVTTGAVKILGIGATGVATGALLGGSPVDVSVNSALTAGAANLLNLFDLRPGRAIKVALLGGTLLTAGAPGRSRRSVTRALAAPVGAALSMLPEDLGERAMLGDAGANALGGMIGAAAAIGLPRPARIAVLAGIAGLTAASEVVSFTKVIERTPPLRWLDMLGRRPVAAPAAKPAAAPDGQGTGDGAWPPVVIPEQAAADLP
jgi:UDP-GlcNAc:undecaprenyl-phosphate GlcNAc-1-phosphate transferase